MSVVRAVFVLTGVGGASVALAAVALRTLPFSPLKRRRHKKDDKHAVSRHVETADVAAAATVDDPVFEEQLSVEHVKDICKASETTQLIDCTFPEQADEPEPVETIHPLVFAPTAKDLPPSGSVTCDDPRLIAPLQTTDIRGNDDECEEEDEARFANADDFVDVADTETDDSFISAAQTLDTALNRTVTHDSSVQVVVPSTSVLAEPVIHSDSLPVTFREHGDRIFDAQPNFPLTPTSTQHSETQDSKTPYLVEASTAMTQQQVDIDPSLFECSDSPVDDTVAEVDSSSSDKQIDMSSGEDSAVAQASYEIVEDDSSVEPMDLEDTTAFQESATTADIQDNEDTATVSDTELKAVTEITSVSDMQTQAEDDINSSVVVPETTSEQEHLATTFDQTAPAIRFADAMRDAAKVPVMPTLHSHLVQTPALSSEKLTTQMGNVTVTAEPLAKHPTLDDMFSPIASVEGLDTTAEENSASDPDTTQTEGSDSSQMTADPMEAKSIAVPSKESHPTLTNDSMVAEKSIDMMVENHPMSEASSDTPPSPKKTEVVSKALPPMNTEHEVLDGNTAQTDSPTKSTTASIKSQGASSEPTASIKSQGASSGPPRVQVQQVKKNTSEAREETSQPSIRQIRAPSESKLNIFGTKKSNTSTTDERPKFGRRLSQRMKLRPFKTFLVRDSKKLPLNQ